MTIRVRRPSGEWDEIATGHVDHHDRGGALHVQTDTEPVFYEPDQWEAFETLPDGPVPVTDPSVEERIFSEGFV